MCFFVFVLFVSCVCSSLCFFFFFFFFFQAEDGIRDLYVTGVQTCALPISCLRDHDHRPGRERSKQVEETLLRNRHQRGPGAGCRVSGVGMDGRCTITTRSEERRVGKECRSRWAPDEEKEKRQSAKTQVCT